MGVIFDLLLLVLFIYSVYIGYKKGFLASASGIIAVMLAFALTGAFSLGILWFVILNILLSVAVAFCAKIIRKLKIPVIRTVDTVLGITLGIIDGLLKVMIIAIIAAFIASYTSTGFFDGSFVVELVSNGSLYAIIRDIIMR